MLLLLLLIRERKERCCPHSIQVVLHREYWILNTTSKVMDHWRLPPLGICRPWAASWDIFDFPPPGAAGAGAASTQ
jgi:hypothetical protein